MEEVMENVILKEYSTYKESTLGKIPTHWIISKLRHLGEFSASGIDKYIKVSESPVKIINFTDVYSNVSKKLNSTFDYMVVSTPENNRIKNLVKKGDLIFLPSSETYEDLGTAALVDEELENTSFSYHVLRFEFNKEINHSFKKYFTNNDYVLRQFSLQGKGTTRKIIGRGIFKNIQVILPPLLEQSCIATFLDRKTEQIDKAIAKKQQLIELLKERKQILINNAVTRGLDHTVPMKDSAVEWIGEIPKHWEVKRAKYLFDEIDERSNSGSEELLSVSHITGVTPRSEKNVTMFQAEDYSDSKLCKENDLVFNIMWAWMGALGVSQYSGIVSPSYAVYRQKCSDEFNAWYLENLLKSINYVAEYNRTSTGLHSSRLRLYSHVFLNMKIGFPPKDEQDLIEHSTNLITRKIDKVIELNTNSIEKLKEYKSTVINSVVTGKIKVS